MNLDKRKAAAACELEGDLYSMQRDLKLAKVMSNNLVDGFFEEENLDCASNNFPMLMLKYMEAWAQVNVLHDYITQVFYKVNDLLKIADEYDSTSVPNTAVSGSGGDMASVTVMAIDLLTRLPEDKKMAALKSIQELASVKNSNTAR